MCVCACVCVDGLQAQGFRSLLQGSIAQLIGK